MALETELKEKLGKDFYFSVSIDKEYVRTNITFSIYSDYSEDHKFSGLDFISLKVLSQNRLFNLESLRACIYNHQQLRLERKKDVLKAIEGLDSLCAEAYELDRKLADLYNRIPNCIKSLWTVRDMCLNIRE